MREPASTTYRATTRPPRRSHRALWTLLFLWICALGLAAGVAAGFLTVYRSDRILVGVASLGRDLSGRTETDAAEVLGAEWLKRSIVLRGADQSWTLAPNQLGVVLDAEGMARQAYAQGRGPLRLDSLLPRARRLLASANLFAVDVDPVDVAPVWRFERDVATRTLRTLAAQIEIATVNAGLSIVEGQIQTTPPVTGRSLDIAAILATLEAHPWGEGLGPRQAAPASFALPIVPQPPAIADVSPVVDEIRPLLARAVAVRLYDPIRNERLTWSASPADMGRWLAFDVVPSGEDGKQRALAWSVDEARVGEFVAARNNEFGDHRYVDKDEAVPALIEAFQARTPAINLHVWHGERIHVVQAGETLSSIAFDYGMPYPWIQAANAGTGDRLLVGDRLRIPSPNVLLPLPVVENKRIVLSLTSQKMQAYEGGALKWDWVISTGIPSSPTSPGVFQIQTHEEMAYAGQWDLYMPWFMGIYRAAPGQDTMNGFHGFPSRDRRQLLWTKDLGRRVTYGCILLSTDNAKLLYDWAEAGVVVEIKP